MAKRKVCTLARSQSEAVAVLTSQLHKEQFKALTTVIAGCYNEQTVIRLTVNRMLLPGSSPSNRIRSRFPLHLNPPGYRRSIHRGKRMKRLLLVIAIIALYLLHQDFWFWRGRADRLRLSARRPLLSRLLHARDLGVDVGAS